jgi:competence protein ComEA
MLKKLLMLFVALGLSLSTLIAAAVEVNTADETTLETVKGIGPAHAKAIIDERTKNGPFKDADDLVSRVKGIGPKSVQNLEAAGLTINGSSAPPAGKPATTSKSSKAATTATTTNPATAAAPAATAATASAAAASGATATKSKKSKKDKTAPAASAPAAASAAPAASAPAGASDSQAKKGKKSKKSKAASDAAASGA